MPNSSSHPNEIIRQFISPFSEPGPIFRDQVEPSASMAAEDRTDRQQPDTSLLD